MFFFRRSLPEGGEESLQPDDEAVTPSEEGVLVRVSELRLCPQFCLSGCRHLIGGARVNKVFEELIINHSCGSKANVQVCFNETFEIESSAG